MFLRHQGWVMEGFTVLCPPPDIFSLFMSRSSITLTLFGLRSGIWITLGYLLLYMPTLIYSILHLNVFPLFLWVFLPHLPHFLFFSSPLSLTGLVPHPTHTHFIFAQSPCTLSLSLFFVVSHILLVMCPVCCSLPSLSVPPLATSLLPWIPSSITGLPFSFFCCHTNKPDNGFCCVLKWISEIACAS